MANMWPRGNNLAKARMLHLPAAQLGVTAVHSPIGQHNWRICVRQHRARHAAQELGVHVLGEGQVLGQDAECRQVQRVLPAAGLHATKQ